MFFSEKALPLQMPCSEKHCICLKYTVQVLDTDIEKDVTGIAHVIGGWLNWL